MNCDLLKKIILFKGIDENEIEAMISCLSAITRKYNKGEVIYDFGEIHNSVGIILSGSVHVIKEDFWGNRSILSELELGQIFGENYAIKSEPLEVNVIAVEPCEILFLDVRRIMTTCSSACEFHVRLVKNLLATIAEKNILLNKKLEYISQRSTKEKLLSYLSSESQKKKSENFTIPFNRQELADYLSVERSAMSKELCKLRDDGILEFNKNNFRLL